MDYLKVYTNFAEVIEPLGEAEIGRLFIAMLKYAEQGATPDLRGNERFIWPIAKQNIDRTVAECEKYAAAKREAGLKGAQKRWQSIAEDGSAISANGKNGYLKEKVKEKDNLNITPPIKSPSKHKYGEYSNVLLSDEDLAKLKSEFTDWQQRIERLSAYKASTGKVYKNDLATIRNWAKRDGDKKAAEDANKPKPSYDMDEISKRFMLGQIK
jgi:hypothetical protein